MRTIVSTALIGWAIAGAPIPYRATIAGAQSAAPQPIDLELWLGNNSNGDFANLRIAASK